MACARGHELKHLCSLAGAEEALVGGRCNGGAAAVACTTVGAVRLAHASAGHGSRRSGDTPRAPAAATMPPPAAAPREKLTAQ
jgi:hypothetical protein